MCSQQAPSTPSGAHSTLPVGNTSVSVSHVEVTIKRHLSNNVFNVIMIIPLLHILQLVTHFGDGLPPYLYSTPRVVGSYLSFLGEGNSPEGFCMGPCPCVRAAVRVCVPPADLSKFAS